MPPRRPPPSAARARLTVLASADDDAFLAPALALLRSKQRLDREAALEALLERPLDGAHEALCELYLALHADRPRGDGGAFQRGAIVRCLMKQPRRSDAAIGVLASETFEKDSNRDDNTYGLRLLGLQLLALTLPPDEMRYYAVEHLDDMPAHQPHQTEPAATAIRLLGETGNYLALYQWLRAADRDAPNLLAAFEALSSGPPVIVSRYIAAQIDDAIARGDEAVCTVFAEAIVKLDIEQAYASVSRMMDARISDELFSYLAVLLASTNRPSLLTILERQLCPGGRSNLVLEALRIRTTPEQQAVIDRWENRA
jgi:hypothetical protein